MKKSIKLIALMLALVVAISAISGCELLDQILGESDNWG